MFGKMTMNIILLGPPGIGKGTQGDILAAKLGLPKISAGQMMREEAAKGTKLGRMIKAYIDRGELVPDETTMKMMDARLCRPNCGKGFILDGFPRTLAQARALGKIACIDLVLNLSAPRKELIERIAGRLTCSRCGEIYHVKFSPSKREGECDRCGEALYAREDQKEAVVGKRLEVYEKETKPLTEFYKKRGLLKNVKAAGSINEVARLVEKAINDFRKSKAR